MDRAADVEHARHRFNSYQMQRHTIPLILFYRTVTASSELRAELCGGQIAGAACQQPQSAAMEHHGGVWEVHMPATELIGKMLIAGRILICISCAVTTCPTDSYPAGVSIAVGLPPGGPAECSGLCVTGMAACRQAGIPQ
jgi:hypothetical protein